LQGVVEARRLRRIAVYAALPDEISLGSLCAWLAPQAELAFPRLCEARLVLHRVQSLADLRTGAFGILEPSADAPVAEPTALELILVPGLLFDRSGGRLGRGRGLYDRLLAEVGPTCTKVGVSREERVVASLPLEPHDVRMDALVTELGYREAAGTT
jgi:5-formyltetrahydrofolate cyclo-ligase